MRVQGQSELGTTSLAHMLRHAGSGSSTPLAQKVDNQNGVDANGVNELLQEARRIIVTARGALF